MSIARQHTLFKTAEVTHIFRTAKRALKHPYLDILLAPQIKEHGRILVIASRKTGNAVKRNLIKRRLKNAFSQDQYHSRGFDCIVIIKKDGIATSFEQLKNLLGLAYAQMAEKNS